MTYILAMSTFGERLAWARKQKKLSQTELAERAGVPLSSIGNAEAGTRQGIRKVASVAAALDVDVKWLSEGEGTHDAHKKHLRVVEGPGHPNWVRLTPAELSLVTTYRETTEDGRAMIEMARGMAEKQIESVILNQSQ
jgi:transcriptional regulator with XRE-family HTH domain